MTRLQTITTELGLEKRCTKCGEYYPADTEFFYHQNRGPLYLHSWCRACCSEDRNDRYHNRRVSITNPVLPATVGVAS